MLPDGIVEAIIFVVVSVTYCTFSVYVNNNIDTFRNVTLKQIITVYSDSSFFSSLHYIEMSEETSTFGGWLSSWFNTSKEQESSTNLLQQQQQQGTNYARNQQTLSSLRSQKQQAEPSNKQTENNRHKLTRSDTEKSYLDAPKSQQAGNGRKITRRLPLTNNHLVVDCPIPDRLLGALNFSERDEFSQLRYTAATCEPDDFETEGYTLRQKIYNRETELFIVMTMYNVRLCHKRIFKNPNLSCRKTKSCSLAPCTVL